MAGAQQCANTADSTGGTNTVAVTAPGDPATTTPASRRRTFTAWSDNDCKQTSSTEFVLKDALTVTPPRPNPNLPPRCGINVMLVLDESGSIASSGQTETVQERHARVPQRALGDRREGLDRRLQQHRGVGP